MGRRSVNTPEELRSKILAASRDIIDQDGFAALSAREIARRIGYTAGTLYNIFENIDEIVRALQSELLDGLADHLDRAAGPDGTRTDIAGLLSEYTTFAVARHRMWAVLSEHYQISGDPGSTPLNQSLDRILGTLSRALQPLIPSAPPEGLERHVLTLWASVHGIASLATSGRVPALSHETAQKLVNCLSSTYAAGLPRPPAREH